MPIYNKLVRDLIPEIIEHSGKQCTLHTMDDAEYLSALHTKLGEELAEYLEADQTHALDELADLLEVVRATVVARGFTLEQLEQVRVAKAEKRGGFAKKLLLEEVTESAD